MVVVYSVHVCGFPCKQFEHPSLNLEVESLNLKMFINYSNS